MDSLIKITIFFAFISALGYYFSRLIIFLEERKSKMYKDTKAEFISDLYRLQIKWAKRGEYDFSEATRLVIESFNIKPKDNEPLTQYGKDTQQRLFENLFQKVKEEIVNEDDM